MRHASPRPIAPRVNDLPLACWALIDKPGWFRARWVVGSQSPVLVGFRSEMDRAHTDFPNTVASLRVTNPL